MGPSEPWSPGSTEGGARRAILDDLHVTIRGSYPLRDRGLVVAEPDDLDEVVFDASALAFCCPMELTGIVAWAEAVRLDGADVTFIAPAADGPASYIGRMDLYTLLDAVGVVVEGRPPKQPRYDRRLSLIETNVMGDHDDVSQFADKLFKIVKTLIGTHEARAACSMTFELVENALTHAESPIGALGAAQVYKTRRRIDIAIADNGMGMRAHLLKNPKNKAVHTHPQAIRRAVKPGASGLVDEPNRGNGLAILLERASAFGATLHFRTGDGRGTAVARPNHPVHVHTEKAECAVPGTWALLSVIFRR